VDDPLRFIIDSVDYDFREDDEEVQGNWFITRCGDVVTVTYTPFDDSPHPPVTGTYQVTRIS
jgi:hypothetical protein